MMFAGVIISAYSLAPQIQLWSVKDHQWNGVYAFHDFDELAYAAYLQSLIDGKPRLNSPYTGNKNEAEHPQAESFFSIQFLAFYPIAMPARWLGLSSSTAMILMSAIIGFLAGLALFWLFNLIFDKPFLSFVGTVLVFSSGALTAGLGSIVAGYAPSSVHYFIAFPFSRRAVPAMGFPALFLFFGFAWKFLSANNRQTKIFSATLAVLSFVFLVYSYFYLWTAAAAWFGALVMLWLIFRFQDWRKTVIPLSVLGSIFLTVLIPYFILLANRAETIDAVALLVLTHQPDLWRIPEILSFVVVIGFIIAKSFGWIDWREPKNLFLLSFALVAPVVFNQQIITGRSLQPIHYQFYGVNYVAAFALIAFVFTLSSKNLNSRIFNVILILLGLFALYIGYSDGQFSVKKGRGTNVWRDDLMPVAQKIKAISQNSEKILTVLSFDFYPYTLMNNPYSLNCSDELPALSSQAVLWSPHQKVFSDLTSEESANRLFKFIYYQNFDGKWLKDELQKGKSELIIGFFGWGRNSDALTINNKPITDEEINEIVEQYEQIRQNFDYQDAQTPTLSYIIVHEAALPDFSIVDKWYERDAGEKVGKFTLYRIKLRNQ